MKKSALILIIFLQSVALFSQLDTTITTVEGVNTPADELICTPIHDRIIYASNNINFDIDDFGVKKEHFYLYSALRSKNEKEFSLSESVFNKLFPADVGTACFDPNDNVLWFSSAYNFDQQKGKSLKIYWTSRVNNKWQPPQSFAYNSSKYNVAHPFLNNMGNQLFFSSDRPGGAGGMDIWYCNKTKKGWSEPIWTGYSVNSKGNEIFPTWNQGDLYFSSDGRDDSEGLDIYLADNQKNWTEIRKLHGGINSSGDDFGMVFLDKNQGYFSSNREGGVGGDDIYHFQMTPKSNNHKLDEYTLQLVCKGTPLRDAQVVVVDRENIVVTNGITDVNGKIDANNMTANTPYKVYVTGIEQKVLSKSLVHLLDENGNKLATFGFNKEGYMRFEYIPIDDLGNGSIVDITDHSVLTLQLQGQVYDQKPGDVGEGIPVYITSSTGEVLALAYTSKDGEFTAEELRPLKGYRFIVKGDKEVTRVNVNDNHNIKIIELNNNSGTYQRLTEDQAIKLLDENHQEIFINKDEIFVIREIYYKFDSAELNEFAKVQLKNLALILENNPEIKIEIASHTDSRGPSDYNLKLSEKRAQVAVNYLESEGIDLARLIPKGYGESQLKNQCNDQTECSEAEHAINRRTEIRIFTN